ncbi:MAG: methyltransferase domain-containing protein [Oscillospiraceae bacterium]|nr:methyltransferase domain-containing protein [Oscillospiraceae bacterium]
MNSEYKAVHDYMAELRLRPVEDPRKFVSRMQSVMGMSKAGKLIDALNRRAKAHEKGDSSCDELIYELKNADLLTSTTMTGATEGETLKSIFTWVCDNREYFGENILEVGCENGIITCFLARQFPEAKITAVDRCAPAIEVAKLLAQRLNVTNAEFICCELSELPRRKYDTLLSSRVAHENHALISSPAVKGVEAQAELFKGCFSEYASLLAEFIGEEGSLLSVERTGRTSLFAGWLYALEEAGLVPCEGGYAEINSRELGSPANFQALVLRHGAVSADALSSLGIVFEDKIDLSLKAWKSWMRT